MNACRGSRWSAIGWPVRGTTTLAAILVVRSIVGCSTAGEVGIDVDEHQALTPTARVRYETDRDPSSGRWEAFELDFARVNGDENQFIPAGNFLIADDEVFNGPVQPDIDARVERTRLLMNVMQDVSAVTFGLITGIVHDSLRLEVDGPTKSDRKHYQSVGIALGVRFEVQPTDWLRFQGQITGSLGYGDDVETEVLDSEVGVTMFPQENIGLFVGYRWWQYEWRPENPILGLVFGSGSKEDIDVDLRGPVIGLEIRF